MVDWPHAPLHRFGKAGIYFITGATYQKQHFFRAASALDVLRDSRFAKAKQQDCWLQAWALLSNHYHLVVACDDGAAIRRMVRAFHSDSAITINRADDAKGRQVWFQFRDTQLTYEASWLARLRYTHENAVHHRLVSNAENYPWCSASWFAATRNVGFVKTVRRMKIDGVRVYDDFEAAPPP